MKKIVINDTIILFLGINDMKSLKQNELKNIKKDYLLKYENCIINTYFDVLNHKKIIKDKINKLKFINQKKVYARNCNVKIIDNETKNKFLNENHIQGTDKSQIFYGAYHKEELISVMTFDDVKGFNGGVLSGNYDLSRFSIKTGFIIVGIFSKILKQFISDYNPQKIISFADLNYVNKKRNIYEVNGFKISKNIQPDFKLFVEDRNKLFHKFTYGSKFKKNKNINENQKKIILNNSHKVWNCGKVKYELFINNNGLIVYGFIYMIRNKINDKKYIGQTIRSLNKRIYEYKAAYKYDTFTNNHLKNAFNKYGWDNFEFTVIDTAHNIGDLNVKEIEYITQYQTRDKTKGYNIEVGGNNAIPTIETLEKMSRSHKGIKQTDNWINKRIAKAGTEEAKKYGKNKTEEEKKHLSDKSPKYWLGKCRDKETKKKISETKKERGLSLKQKETFCKKVFKKDVVDGSLIKSFESTKEASEIEKVNQSTISRWCKNNKIVDNVIWSY